MYKIKFPSTQKIAIMQVLGITESENYEVVLCESSAMMEEGKINIVFQIDKLDEVKSKLAFFTETKQMYLAGKSSRGDVRIPVSQIRFIESMGNDVYTFVNKQKIMLPSKLYQFEEELEPFGFVRISKSVLVNVTCIEAVATGFNGKLKLGLSDNYECEVNRSYTKQFKKFLES